MDPNFPKNNPKIKIISTIQQPLLKTQMKGRTQIAIQKSNKSPKSTLKANEFENLFQRVQQDIEQNDVLYNLSPQMENEQVNYQFWRFEFSGQGNFEGKCISGVLKLQSDHPVSPPVFYFDSIFIEQKYEVLQHLNIYGDHTLCIPLFSYWKKTTSEYEILQAIEHIFHNPNFQEGDAPANPNFASQTEEQKLDLKKIGKIFTRFLEGIMSNIKRIINNYYFLHTLRNQQVIELQIAAILMNFQTFFKNYDINNHYIKCIYIAKSFYTYFSHSIS